MSNVENTANHPRRRVDRVAYTAQGGGRAFAAAQTSPSSYRWSVDYGGEKGVASGGNVGHFEDLTPRQMRRSMKRTGKQFVK